MPIRCAHCGARTTIVRLIDGLPSCECCAEYAPELAELLHTFGLYTESRDGLYELIKGSEILLRGNARELTEWLLNQPIPYRPTG